MFLCKDDTGRYSALVANPFGGTDPRSSVCIRCADVKRVSSLMCIHQYTKDNSPKVSVSESIGSEVLTVHVTRTTSRNVTVQETIPKSHREQCPRGDDQETMQQTVSKKRRPRSDNKEQEVVKEYKKRGQHDTTRKNLPAGNLVLWSLVTTLAIIAARQAAT